MFSLYWVGMFILCFCFSLVGSCFLCIGLVYSFFVFQFRGFMFSLYWVGIFILCFSVSWIHVFFVLGWYIHSLFFSFVGSGFLCFGLVYSLFLFGLPCCYFMNSVLIVEVGS